MHGKARKLLFVAVVILALGFLAKLVLFSGPLPAHGPRPNPNGFDDILKAAELESADPGNYPTMDREQLVGLISTNSESLRLLRLGLSRQCAVPIETHMTNLTQFATDLPGLKRLAQLLAAEGRLRQMEGRPGDAALCYAQAIHLGNETSRGFILHRLVGVACEAIGYVRLSAVITNLNCADSQPVLAELASVAANRVTWEEVKRNENAFMRYEMAKSPNPITWVSGWWQGRQAIKGSALRHNSTLAHVSLLTIELNLRCYLADHGQPPATLDELVPRYLKTLPSDPFSGKPLIYRPQGTNWLLYSVGPDGVDDGGMPAGRSTLRGISKGDILYNSPW
jgi:hypothetical protein